MKKIQSAGSKACETDRIDRSRRGITDACQHAIRMSEKSKNGITKADRGSQYTRATYNSLPSLTFFPLLLILPWLNVFF